MKQLQITYGIPQPRDEARTTNEMRRAIFDVSNRSAVVRRALIAAQSLGMNGEDTYVLLAYNALLSLEEHAQARVRLLEIVPFNQLFKDTPGDARGS